MQNNVNEKCFFGSSVISKMLRHESHHSKAAKLKERDYYVFFFHPKTELKFPYLLIYIFIISTHVKNNICQQRAS